MEEVSERPSLLIQSPSTACRLNRHVRFQLVFGIASFIGRSGTIKFKMKFGCFSYIIIGCKKIAGFKNPHLAIKVELSKHSERM
jgi:hypothetical protein